MGIIASDQITIVDITDAYSVMLTSESYTFNGDSKGAITGQSCSTEIVVFCGNNPCSVVNIKASEIVCPSGISATVENSGGSKVKVTFKTTKVFDESCEAIIPITADGITVSKKFSFAVAKDGATGAQGPQGLQGIQGPQGEQGIQGPAGKDGTNGKTSYFHIKYSPVENPTASQMTETPSTYIGTYVDYVEADSTDPNKYTWYRFQGLQGTQGTQGIPGTNGADGKTSYLHIKYSNDGGKTFTSNSGETVGDYIGQCTDFNKEDPTTVGAYTWSKIKGETGNGISIVASNGTVFKTNNDSTVLTAHVFDGGEEKTIADNGVCGNLGTVKWYVDGKAVATGKNYTVQATAVADTIAIKAQLESNSTVKATTQITISKVIDVYAVYRYYKLQASTLAQPSKPTKNPPDGWSDTEPSYVSGSTNTLYFVDCNVYSDKTFSFSEVSKSSTYEAAKDAWNKANNAQESIDNLEIGGRNLLLNTASFSNPWYIVGADRTDEGNFKYVTLRNSWSNYIRQILSTLIQGNQYTVSFYAKCEQTKALEIKDDSSNNKVQCQINIDSKEWKRYSKVFTLMSSLATPYELVTLAFLTRQNDVPIYIKQIKLEKGNKATDWTPAPEDSIQSVDVEYYLSTSATSLSGGSWTTLAPAWVDGKFMWSRTVMVDGAGNKTYSPNQNGVCIAGATGSTGATGKGVKSIVEQYYKSSSATTLSGGSWSTTYPGWENGKYIWTRSVITYTDNITATTTAVCVTGAKGDTGTKGDTGSQGYGLVANVTREAFTESQWSTYGTIGHVESWSSTSSIRNGCRVGDIFAVIGTATDTKNSHIAYYRSTTASGDLKGECISHTITPRGATGAKGDTGATGKGVKSTAVTYQAGSSGTTIPTGTWSSTVPSTTASMPYLWSRTIITYTDNTSSTTYSVGSTPESVVVGGRNLLLNTLDLTKWLKESGVTVEADTDGWFKVTSTGHTSSRWGIYATFSGYEQNTEYTMSVYMKTGTNKAYLSIGYDNWGTFVKESTDVGTKYSYTFNTGSNTGTMRIYIHMYPTANGNYCYIKLPKLEKGNKATDWTPAPEDMVSQSDLAQILRYNDTQVTLGKTGSNMTLNLRNDGLNIQKGSDVSATFESDKMTLGDGYLKFGYDSSKKNTYLYSDVQGTMDIYLPSTETEDANSVAGRIHFSSNDVYNTASLESGATSVTVENVDHETNKSTIILKGEAIKINSEILEDYIIAQGTSGIWAYRKYHSGIAEIWGKYTVTATNMYGLGLTVGQPKFPFAFKEVPVIQAGYYVTGDAASGIRYVNGTTTDAQVYGWCQSGNVGKSGVFNIHAFGKYK